MVRSDHPNNLKRGGVGAYVRESLRVRNFNNLYLSQCLTLAVTISNKKGYVVTLYEAVMLSVQKCKYKTTCLPL